MNTPGKASLPVIKRLPKYYRYLRTLKNDGITSISSRELAAQMGTTASQVRQDFNCIGDVNGRQGIGYSVENLLSILEQLLFGNGDRLPTILIGCGRLGKAVSRFITTDTNGYRLIAAFDNSPSEVGREINGIQILHIDELETFCAEHKPEVAVLCLPRSGAEEISGRLVDMGIKGFWNFSHYDLSVPYPEVVVENVHLGDSLMSLGYRLIAAFDVAQSEVGKEISGIQIRHIDELESFCAEHHPKVAVLCVPRDGAEQVSGRLVDLGIEGFWNFSHYDLSVPYPDVVVENVHLGDSLMSLGYRLRNQD